MSLDSAKPDDALTLSINDRTITASPGQTILTAASAEGIEIPTLCFHSQLPIDGSCRLCMVESDSHSEQVAACSTPVQEGMVVRTESEALTESRRLVLELLLRNYHGPADADNEFMRWVRHYDAKPHDAKTHDAKPQFAPNPPRHVVDSDANPFIRVDLNQCILCTRCVRACNDIQGRYVWSVSQRGGEVAIVAGAGSNLLDAGCESCGACEALCPTGALSDRMSFDAGCADKQVSTTCGYCGVGCQLDLNVRDDRIIRVTSREDAPVNGEALCVKGRYGWDFVHHSDRLTQPLVRPWLLEGGRKDPSQERRAWQPVDWETALRITASKLSQFKQESGPKSIGVLSSAKCTNEENYLMQKFARQVIGTNNVDHCARLCHSSTVAGLAMAFGSGAMSNSMRDIVEQAAALFIIGSNTTEQHPVFGAMIRQAVAKRGVPLLVADPRGIDICEFAALHIRQRPGTDVALLNGLMHIVLANGWHDQEFIEARCDGFEDLRETIENYPPRRVAELTGVSEAELHQAAELLALNHPMAVIWAMGITQHTTGVMNVLSLANLQMLLGNMGLPGGGVNPLRGQNNVQGACDLGGLPNVFPGYQAVASEEIRTKFAQAWSLEDPQALASPGLTVTEMIEAAGAGRVRGLYILGEDPAMTEPDSNHARRCLQATEFLALQEIFPSETAQYADVLLPGASFAEKSGTFTNTERRVQLIGPAVPPPGDAQPDWRITSQLAQEVVRNENRTLGGRLADWDYATAAEVMDEIAELTPSYTGVNHHRLEQGEQLQWPVLGKEHAGTPILHCGRFTRGKGQFHAVDHLEAKEAPDAEYPLLLTTGRVLYHWHGGELTRRAKGLLEIYPETILEVSSEDAARFGIRNESKVCVTSRRGEMQAKAVVSERVSEGVVFGNFHFPGLQNVNNLTIGAVDPIAKIPEYKVCAVALKAT